MAVTINSTTFDNLYLTEQPAGYDEQDATRGQTAAKWLISGLMSGPDWLDLQLIYDTWRDIRITEEDPATSNVVGTTVSLSIDGFAGQSWSGVNCWFLSAPSATQSGSFVSVSFELVDANQSLELIQLQAETSETELLPNFGTITINGTVLTLRKPLYTYGDGPQLELTASGQHLVTGPLVVYRIKDVEGETDLTGWNSVRSWYESQIITVPIAGSDFPITAPTATAERKVISGVPTDIYTVSIQLGEVI
jgi:hypothetical protein